MKREEYGKTNHLAQPCAGEGQMPSLPPQDCGAAVPGQNAGGNLRGASARRAENFSAVRPEASSAGAKASAASCVCAQEKRWNRKRLVLLLALVFFFFSVIVIIPVGHIPGLRNLAWWMGFSPEDTQSVSFARALLSWSFGDENVSPAKDGELALFDRQNRREISLGEEPPSGLFNLAAVNASLRALGRKGDYLAGAAGSKTQDDAPAVNHQINDWSDQARAALEKAPRPDAYFGTDAQIAARAAAENVSTRGSTGTLALVRAPGVIGAARTDYLGMVTDKAALKSNAALEAELKKRLPGAANLSNLGGSITGTDDEAKKHLAWVWLMSRAAQKAPQPMLKKQLSSAGYMAMDMPKKVYDSSGEGSGVRLSGDELMGDVNAENMRLKDEKKCRELAAAANENIQATMNTSQAMIDEVRRTVPKTCGGDIGGWGQKVEGVRKHCGEIKKIFNGMSLCGVKLKSEGRCETAKLDNYVTEFTGLCDVISALESKGELTEEEQNQLNAAKNDLGDLTGDVDGDIEHTFTNGEGGNDFFPETERTSGWGANAG